MQVSSLVEVAMQRRNVEHRVASLHVFHDGRDLLNNFTQQLLKWFPCRLRVRKCRAVAMQAVRAKGNCMQFGLFAGPAGVRTCVALNFLTISQRLSLACLPNNCSLN
jgi:hypothetical protein